MPARLQHGYGNCPAPGTATQMRMFGLFFFFSVPKQGLIIQATELELREAAKLNETGST